MSHTRLPQRLRIGIDGRILSASFAGKGRYVSEIVRSWIERYPDDDVTLYILAGTELPFRAPSHWHIVSAPASFGGSLWMGFDAWRRKLASLFVPTSYMVSIASLVPTVLTVHDLAAFRSRDAGHTLKVQLAERTLLGLAARRATAIVADSGFSRDELLATFALNPDKVHVVWCGVQPPPTPLREKAITELRHRYALEKQFLLFVGTLEPRKNLPRLIEAYHGLPVQLKQTFPLYLVGRRGWGTDAVLEAIERTGEHDRVKIFDFVSDADLAGFYQLATAVIYPSLYEGFGLPPLEAMSYGKPVVTSQVTSIPEVVGEAALLIDPMDVVSIQRAIQRILEDSNLQHDLANKGLHQVKQFPWETTMELVRNQLLVVANHGRIGHD